MKILEELYFVNICPGVKFHDENSYFAQLERLREKNRENLLKHLSETEEETFDKFNDAQAEIDDMIRYERFNYGFKLGILLMAETFMGAEKMAGGYE